MNRILAIVSLAVGGAIIAVISSRGGSEPLKGSFVGNVVGTSALTEVVTDGELVRAYACDRRSMTRWISGRGHDNMLDVRAGGLRLQAKLTATEATGTLTLEDGEREHGC